MAYRRCGSNGLWLAKRPNETSSLGWTNYSLCFPPEVRNLFDKVYEDETDGQIKFEIAQWTRWMEIAGFSISLIALTLSLIIFSRYRSLRNDRTRIHRSLLLAMIVQVLIRLILYIDQALIRSSLGDQATNDNVTFRGIDNMPYLCESSYVLLEYATTVMFMWMFLEGIYLHRAVAGNALREKVNHVAYCAAGWGLPLIFTTLWALMTAALYKKEKVKICWYGYNFSQLYWIVQGPRLAVIIINMVFLLNIMRVLIVKLRRSENTEIEKVRKAVRAALVLLPLLGITNILNMTEAPLGGSVWEFGLWSFGTHFLRSFQGFFIALIYCFLNGEVRKVLTKHYENYKSMRMDPRDHQGGGAHRPSTPYRSRLERQTWISMRSMKWNRRPPPPGPNMEPMALTETELGPEPIRAVLKEARLPDSNSDQLSRGSEHEYEETSFSKDAFAFTIEKSRGMPD